jgi:hypothetical protein
MKLPWREADHLRPSRAQGTNPEHYYVFMWWSFIKKHKNGFKATLPHYVISMSYLLDGTVISVPMVSSHLAWNLSK